MTRLDRSADAGALAWLVSVGADEAIGEEPVDRLPTVALRSGRMEASPPPARRITSGEGSPPSRERAYDEVPLRVLPLDRGGSGGGLPAAPPEIPLGTPEAAESARDLAAACQSLDELKDAIARFDGLTLKATATNLVFADGNPKARLMLVGEAPGAEEDRRGLPFVGAAGQLLDRMLAAIGHDRSNSYITNIVNWRPPGNRKPSPAEMLLCRPFIERHIALVDPAVLVLLGDTSAKTLTNRNEGITRLRGRWFTWTNPTTGQDIPLMPTFHPAFLLRSPGQKREAWIDLLAIKQKLMELNER